MSLRPVESGLRLYEPWVPAVLFPSIPGKVMKERRGTEHESRKSTTLLTVNEESAVPCPSSRRDPITPTTAPAPLVGG